MDIFDACEPIDWELTDEELDIRPAGRYGQLRHEAKRHRQSVMRGIRKWRRRWA